MMVLTQACQVKSGDAPGGGIFSGHQPTANAFTLTTNLNRTYLPGENIEFNLNFPKSVTITGNPTLALTIGATARTATFFSGNNSSTLVFRYTVVNGDNDTDGITVGSTLGMSGATCTYESTNACGTTIQLPSLVNVRVLSNLPPVANNITPPAFNEDTQSIITLSYTDSEGDLATTCALSALVKVQVTQACACDGAGVCTVGVTGTPNANGAASFNYTVTANGQLSNSASATLTINSVPDAPIAFPVNAPSFDEGTQSIITLNYSDGDSDLATSCSVSGLTNVTETQACACAAGICTVGVTGSPLNYSGSASFNYTVTANAQVSNSAPVTFTINDISNPPVANNITPAPFNEDTQSIITLSYTDADGDAAVSCAIVSPTNVTVTQACACAAGVCTVGVTGTTNYNGSAGFGYTVNTGANSNTASASFTITPVDDAPSTSNFNPPAFDENTQSVITLPYSDVESDQATVCTISNLNNVTVTQACACAAGVCTVGVTGTLNYSGAASFDFSVTANSATSNVSTANFTINNLDQAPVADNISPPSFNEDVQSIITLSYTDGDGDLATACALSTPSNVTETQACACDGLGVCTVGVTGTTDYYGAASFNYTITANSNTSNSATASLVILPIDDAPVAANITPPNFDKNTQSVMTLSYTDVESDQATTCSLSNLTNVTVTQACACAAGVCTVGVTGTLNYAGAASFDYTVTANALVSNSASSTFTIDDTNTAPVADNISPASFNEDVQSVITLSYTDADSDLASSCTITSPTNVTVTQACACDGAGVCTVGVTGTADYNGSASFNYTVTANTQASNSATASLMILPIDDAPVAANITPPNFDKNTQSIMTLSYTDAESDQATACTISNLSNVTVTQACACAAGVCTVGVTGTTNYFGSASFDYTVTANSAVSNVASSTFTIDDTNTAPVADNITPAAFNEDVQSVITLSYTDVDTDLATSCSITSPTNVTVTQACACAAGTCTVGVTGSPLHYNGVASFNYTVTANGQASNSATATLTITAVDDAPVASNITPPNFDKNTQSVMTLSYTDVESDQATVCTISNLSNVTVTQACACAAGVCTVGVTGTSNYFGAASFDYTVTANSAVSNVASSTFTIDDTNTAPVADNITPAAFNEDVQSVITLSYTDVDADLATSCSITSPTNVTVTQACACAAGTCTVGVTGSPLHYNGAASFNYTVTANGQASNSASATLSITAVDDAPVANNITPPNFDKNTQSVMTLSYTDVESDQATVCSISNLSNVTVTQACACAAGVCTVGVTGTTNYFGAASFDYTVTANSVLSNVASSTFTIDDTNTPPVADNISPAAFNEDVQSVITLSYTDVDTDLASSCSITSPTNVTVTQACACAAGTCTVGVTGNTDYNGSASFSYTVTANTQTSNSATATLVINSVDDAPVASNITPAAFDKNTESIMTLSYTDVESDQATSCSISNLSNVTVTTPCACAGGTCTVGVTGTLNYFGPGSFDYTVTANSLTSNVASSTFTINNTNTPPVADNITPAAFNEDVQSVITLSYSDVDGDLATSCSITSPTNVTVTQACACAAGSCTVGVTGTADYFGAASFSYTVTANSQASNSASATLTINSVDDAPVASNITPPDFGKNTQSVMTLAYTDVESDQATTCSISNLSNVTVTQACACATGVCTVGVTGTLNYSGAASFDYTVTANSLVSNVASSSFNITETPPVANNITPAAFNEDIQSVITLSYSDADGDQATACAISSPSNVTVTQACSCAAGTCTVGVTGTTNYNGAASFSYTVTAAGQGSNTATATLSITPVDDAPVATNINPPNFNKNAQSVMTLAYTDVESDQATTCAISALSNVTVTQACACAAGVCTVGVTGTTNYFGPGSFNFTVTANSATSNAATSNFTIDNSNTPPVANNISPAAFNEDTQSVITLSYSDVDLDQATSCSVTSPTNVTVTQACACAAGTCTVGVTGTSNYNGTASFAYTVTAGGQPSNSATATLSITAVDDKPVGVPLTPAAFNEDTQSPGISLTYTDVEGDQATSCTISNLTNVTVTSPCTCTVGACTVAVTGTANYHGTASFDYTVTANGLTSDPRPVSLTITSVPDAPTTANITPPSFNEDTQSVITLTHTVVGGDTATSCAVTSPVNVTVTQACACAAGVCTVGVTGTLNYFGAASFQWTVSSGSAQSVSRNAALTINSVNDAPVIATIAAQTTPVDTDKAVTFNFTDVDSTLACNSTRLTMTSSNTAVVLNSAVVWSGSWTSGTPTCTATITPVAGAAGATTITFNGNDGSGGNTSRVFTLTVNGASLKWYNAANTAPITAYDFGAPGTNTDITLHIRNVGNATSGTVSISELSGENRIGTNSTCTTIPAGQTCPVVIYWQEANPKRVKTETFQATDGTSTTPVLTVTGEKL